MNDASPIGTWQLIATARSDSEIAFIGEEPDPAGVADWLNGRSAAGATVPAAGLLLEIQPNGRFTERRTGTPAVDWFDAEGVLADKPSPFDGTVLQSGLTAYLRPDDIASWARPEDGRYAPAVLRYDDGDTKIADSVTRDGPNLLRTVNVVTDELYLTRVVLVYAPAGSS